MVRSTKVPGRVPLLLVLLVGAACGPGTSGPQAAPPATESVVTPPDGWDPWVPSYSPDGSRIAWFGYDDRYRPRVGVVEDSSLEALTPPSMRAADLAWMPDSNGLLVAYQEDRRTKFAVVDLEGTVVDRVDPKRRIVSESTGMVVLDDRTVVVSATTTWGEMSPADLYRVDLATGEVENITATSTVSEEWPEPLGGSRWLISGGLLTTQEGGPTGWAGIFDAETRKTTRLTGPSFFVDKATRVPGTSRVVFDTSLRNDRGIWETDLSGSKPQQLRSATEVRWPVVSPDGRNVLFKVIGTPSDPGDFVRFELPSDGAG